jgi:5'-phosphate synthase pdxT subunit
MKYFPRLKKVRMMKMIKVGVLAFQGSVAEHIETTRLAAQKIGLALEVVEVRTNESLRGLNALIIPGGESTTLYKLCNRAGMWEGMKKIRNIFGTCAGAIMMAKKVRQMVEGQETLELMDMEMDRNAYGTQINSFAKAMDTSLGPLEAVFIRAPRIMSVGKGVRVLASNGGETCACEQSAGDRYYLAACFHPEFTTTLFHEHFLKKAAAQKQIRPG